MEKCGFQRRARNSIKNKNEIKKNRIWHSHFTPLPGRPWGADFYTFWRVGSYGRRNHPCQILSRLVKGLGGYGRDTHWLWMSLLQQCYALTFFMYLIIECVCIYFIHSDTYRQRSSNDGVLSFDILFHFINKLTSHNCSPVSIQSL